MPAAERAREPFPQTLASPTPVGYECRWSLDYSTYLGGASSDYGEGIEVDSTGVAYLAGIVYSSDFPVANPYQSSRVGNIDAFVCKLSSAGSQLAYCTYLGGTEGDSAYGLALENGCAYVTGWTDSHDFPTVNPYQASYAFNYGPDNDAFVAKVGSSGSSLLYSTYFGGTNIDDGKKIRVDSGEAYVCGNTSSTNFPTVSAYQSTLCGDRDVFFARFDSSGSRLLYSSYLGGTGYDRCYDISVGGTLITLGGDTRSADFPTVNAYQGSFGGGNGDMFVTALNRNTLVLQFSTYLGGADDEYGTAVYDAGGYVHAGGYTQSADFPTANPYQAAWAGEFDMFVSKFGTSGTGLLYSTYFGGEMGDYLHDLLVSSGQVYLCGATYSEDYPIKYPYQASQSVLYSEEAVVSVLSATGSSLVRSTYLGGSSWDQAFALALSGNSIYLTGYTESGDFPIENAYQASNAGMSDAFVSKLSVVCQVWPSPSPSCSPTPEPTKTPGPSPTATPLGYKTPAPSPSATATPFGYQTPTTTPWIATPTPCYPLQVSGRVIDRLTSQPISGAQARAEVPDSSSEAGGSQGDGTFAVTVPCTSIGTGTVTVTGRKRGYLPWQVDRSYADWDDVTGVEIALMPSYSEPGIESGDYDGDGTADAAVFRPGEGLWALRDISRIYYGISTDDLVPGDYDGDGTAEAGIFRASGSLWAIRGLTRWNFGKFSDVAAPGDYDGDGTAEPAVFGQRGGLWAARGVTRTYYGQEDDQAVGGDYDGDGKREPAVFRGNGGYWAIKDLSRVYLGTAGDRLSPGDYAGEGKWRPAVFRASEGLWVAQGLTRLTFGMSGDRPAPADYDGNAADDFGVFRGDSMLWAVKDLTRIYFGTSTDVTVTR